MCKQKELTKLCSRSVTAVKASDDVSYKIIVSGEGDIRFFLSYNMCMSSPALWREKNKVNRASETSRHKIAWVGLHNLSAPDAFTGRPFWPHLFLPSLLLSKYAVVSAMAPKIRQEAAKTQSSILFWAN
jgi:hypothetical protein